MKAANTVSKAVAGMIPQGGYTVPSVAEKIQQLNEVVEKVAHECGRTKDEVVNGLSTENLQSLNNPLDYSWIVWQDKDTHVKRINSSTQVSFILAWDSILRLMASNSPELNGKTFYPGIIIRKDYMGLCLEKNITSCGTRHYIMMNPYLIPNDDDLSIALYLMNLASHELAHLACGTYEAHGETFSYTRESIMNHNLVNVNAVMKMLRSMGFKKLLNKVEQKKQSEDYSYFTLDDIIDMADNKGIDVQQLQDKYSNQQILRMRLIMAIKKAG